jgi:polysaccharide export outer membrane protein
MSFLARLAPVVPIAIVAAVLALPGCDSTPDRRLLQDLNTQGFGNRYSGNAEEENWVAIGDQLCVTDPGLPDQVDSTAVVESDGTVVLPEVGRLNVAGRTTREIESMLRERTGIVQRVWEVTATRSSERYFVFGAVRVQGAQPLRGPIEIADAVLLARPVTDAADLRKVILVRSRSPWSDRLELDVSERIGGTGTGGRALIRDGDIVYVPAIREEGARQSATVLLAGRGE